jgi:hypothetical protein
MIFSIMAAMPTPRGKGQFDIKVLFGRPVEKRYAVGIQARLGKLKSLSTDKEFSAAKLFLRAM